MYLEKEQDTWHLGGCNEENKKKKKKVGRKDDLDKETGRNL